MPTDPQHTPTIIQPSISQLQLKQRSRRPKRKDTEVPQPSGPTDNVADEAVNEEMDDSLVRVATTASSLEAEQGSGNINKTQSKATLNELSSLGTSSGVNTPRSDEDRLKLNELMEFYTKLQQRIVDLENTKTAQAQEITSLKLRVNNSATTTTTIITNDEITLAKAHAELKSAKLPTTTAATTITAASIRPKAKGIIIHEQEQALTPTVSSQQPSQLNVQDKGKGKMVKPKPMKKLSKKDQLMLDEELAFKLQAEEEEERLAREKAQQIKEANIVSWDNV
ncbi:hypothetical protein Tco_0982994 [Tanacetum coccineum]